MTHIDRPIGRSRGQCFFPAEPVPYWIDRHIGWTALETHFPISQKKVIKYDSSVVIDLLSEGPGSLHAV